MRLLRNTEALVNICTVYGAAFVQPLSEQRSTSTVLSEMTYQSRRPQQAFLCISCCLLFFATVGRASTSLQHNQLSDTQLQASTKVTTTAPSAFLSLNNSANTFPANVSGTYKGTWHLSDPDAGASALPVLKQGQGTIAFQLEATPSGTEEVLNVQGDLVLRDGGYVSERDAFMKLEGLYVTATGRLHAVLNPVDDVQLSLAQEDLDMHTADYRKALRGAAITFEESQLTQRPRNLSDPSTLQKDCELMLDLSVVSASNASVSPQAAEQREGSSLLGRVLGRSNADEPAADAVLNGTLYSSNCGISLQINATTTHVEEYEAKAVNYTFMVTALTFVQVLLLLRQMEATNTQATASKVSLLMLGQQAVMDAYLCLLHLTTGFVVEPLFNAFATAAFFEFVNFAIFEMQYLLSIWRARRGPALDTWHTQRELAVLYVRFYGALLGSIFITYQSQRFIRPILMLVYSFWIPQVVHCARTDVRQPLRPLYVIGMSVTRLLLPLYLYGCPSNVLRVSPSPAFCVLLVAWVSSQAAVLMCQTVWGPRWFVPKRFLPAKYEYHRAVVPREVAEGILDSSSAPVDVETGDGGCECVICMNPADVGQPQARMVTPCNHFFHNHCLERWMDVKMECPTCRRPLPTP